jgi:zinc/manganese transport system substrate-binding protein
VVGVRAIRLIRRASPASRRASAPSRLASPASRRALAAILPALLAIALAACGSGSTADGGKVSVVAAENFWGSIAAQVAGSKANVQSIIVDPAEDPHSYEPTAANARTLATAQLAIVNGVGYDPWAPKLLAANPVPGRVVLTVGGLFGLTEGDNPHRWYDPAEVLVVANTVAANLKKLDPNDAAYFDKQLKKFETTDLAQYHSLIAQIASRYGGTPVGASESIFALQAPALHLRLRTPDSFMKAISEGTDVSAQDTLTTQRQIETHQIKVWIYNSQNTTPAVQRLNELAKVAQIPTVTITETLDPATDSFEQWQLAQLQRIQAALHRATGR